MRRIPETFSQCFQCHHPTGKAGEGGSDEDDAELEVLLDLSDDEDDGGEEGGEEDLDDDDEASGQYFSVTFMVAFTSSDSSITYLFPSSQRVTISRI